ncbi:transposase [Ideonella sp. BN130291]|nr:transposase [Ideonella sp. BN130291]
MNADYEIEVEHRWPQAAIVNNKIKVIKRMAYGFRDDNYFFLKIGAAFTGVG